MSELSELREVSRENILMYAARYAQLLSRPSTQSRAIAMRELDELLDKTLDAVIASLPEPKQKDLVGKGAMTLTEEGRQRFYRYGGYDFALNEVTQLLQSAKSKGGE